MNLQLNRIEFLLMSVLSNVCTVYIIFLLYFFSGDLLLSGSGHSDWLSCAMFHPSRSRLATTSGDGTIKLWDYSKTVCLNTLTDHQQPGTYVHTHTHTHIQTLSRLAAL